MAEKNSSVSYSRKEFFYDDQRTPGDVEIYNFNQPHDCVSIFCSTQHTSEEFIPELPVDISVILNNKIMTDLLALHAQKNDSNTETKRANNKKKTPLIQVKSLKDTLNRIARYNNKRKMEERFGFASTLYINAEEIGIINTMKFLLKTIKEHLVRS